LARPDKEDLMSNWLSLLIALVMLAIGAVNAWLLIKGLLALVTLNKWRQTPCEIVYFDVRKEETPATPVYAMYVVYTYEFCGRIFESDRYNLFETPSRSSPDNWFKLGISKGSTSVCFVNAEKPEEAVLTRGGTIRGLAIRFAGALFTILGVYFIIDTIGRMGH
jgi:hypothetical protein